MEKYNRKRPREDEEQSNSDSHKFQCFESATQLFAESSELVLHMMSFMDPLDIKKASQVCHQWKSISEDRHMWRKLVQEQQYRVRTDTLEPPRWSTSWQGVWNWFYQSKKRIFTDSEEKNGLGTYCWTSNGSRYEGEWANNKENGRGIKYWYDGASFEGEWKDSKFNGTGTHTWASGSSYEGNWVNHKRNGYGKNTWVQNDCYTGNWVDDQKHGLGIYVWNDGRTYEGEWANDKRSGCGIFTWPKLGCKYEGNWADDNRHGFGRFTWKDGDVYEGEWVKGKRFGKGKLIVKDGQVFEQEWREIIEFDASNKGDIFQLKTTEDNRLLDQAYSPIRNDLTADDIMVASFLDNVRKLQ